MENIYLLTNMQHKIAQDLKNLYKSKKFSQAFEKSCFYTCTSGYIWPATTSSKEDSCENVQNVILRLPILFYSIALSIYRDR